MAGDDHGPARERIRWRCLLRQHSLPARLSIQAADGQFCHAHLPPKHQRAREHLPRHPQHAVEPRAHHLERCAPRPQNRCSAREATADQSSRRHPAPRTCACRSRDAVLLSVCSLLTEPFLGARTARTPRGFRARASVGGADILTDRAPPPRRRRRPCSRNRSAVQVKSVALQANSDRVDCEVCDVSRPSE